MVRAREVRSRVGRAAKDFGGAELKQRHAPSMVLKKAWYLLSRRRRYLCRVVRRGGGVLGRSLWYGKVANLVSAMVANVLENARPALLIPASK